MPRRFILPLLLATLLVLTGCARDIRAEEAVGTSYEGTHDAGGIIELTLSGAGDKVTAMVVSGVAGGGCSWDTIDLSNWGVSIDIVDGHFESINADGDRFSGQLLTEGRAEGLIQVHDPEKGCETPPLRWVAQALR